MFGLMQHLMHLQLCQPKVFLPKVVHLQQVVQPLRVLEQQLTAAVRAVYLKLLTKVAAAVLVAPEVLVVLAAMRYLVLAVVAVVVLVEHQQLLDKLVRQVPVVLVALALLELVAALEQHLLLHPRREHLGLVVVAVVVLVHRRHIGAHLMAPCITNGFKHLILQMQALVVVAVDVQMPVALLATALCMVAAAALELLVLWVLVAKALLSSPTAPTLRTAAPYPRLPRQ